MTVNDAVYRLPSGTASTSPLAAARVHRATPPPPHGPVGSASSGTDVPTSSQGEQALTPRRVPDQAVSEATGRHMDERAAAQRRAGAPAAGARPGASPLHCRGRTQHAHAAAAHARTRAAERWLCRVRRKSRCCSGWWPALRPNTCRAGLHSGVGSPGDEQILGRPRRRLQHSPRAAGAQKRGKRPAQASAWACPLGHGHWASCVVRHSWPGCVAVLGRCHGEDACGAFVKWRR